LTIIAAFGIIFPVMDSKVEMVDIPRLSRCGYWPAQAARFYEDGDFSRAVDLCLRRLEKEPDSISGRLILARSFYATGQYLPARDHFIQVLRLDADNLVALKFLGDLLYRDGEVAAAMSYYRRVMEIDPGGSGLSSSLSRPDKVETSKVTLRRAGEKVAPKKAGPLREPAFITETVGDIYLEQGYLRLAHEVYRRLAGSVENNRIAGKLRDIEAKLKEKEGIHENSH